MSHNPSALALPSDDPRVALRGLKSLLARVDRKQPDPAAVAELQHYLDTTPGLWRALGDLARIARDITLDQLTSGVPLSTRMSLEKGSESLRADLGYRQAGQLEKMLIDHVVICWIQFHMVEFEYMSARGTQRPLAQAQFTEKRLDTARRRWLRACEAPALQLNVALDGGRQVNLAGDLTLSPQPPE